jgi:carboxylesterase type B
LDYDRNAAQMSDIDGLNLNIYVPAEGVTADSNLPVFAFIHGGGFNGGSSSFPPHDMTRLVRLSTAKGMPVIGVSLKYVSFPHRILRMLTIRSYRVGAPGFLHATEMKEAGYLPNNGFRDQRTGLLWLQKYIGGFGGDPGNVTLMGESAGAVSTAVHLHSKQPLFKRAMLMSGSTLLMGPSPITVADGNYQRASNALGLDSLTPDERVQKLVSMDGQQLRTTLVQHRVAPLVSIPLVDGDMCPVEVDFKTVIDGSLSLLGRQWCESVLLGDCAFDVSDTTSQLLLTTRLTDILLSGQHIRTATGQEESGHCQGVCIFRH